MLDNRAVLYTDDFEPITVLELSANAKNYLEQRGIVRLAVHEPITLRPWNQEIQYEPLLRTVTIWSERVVRKGRSHLMLFTGDDECALLLQSAFLPGQRRQLNDERAKSFGKGFLHALNLVGL